jgi:glyoxylase-like metal-dependent hydrolase (beta-lactamase superfamily II)
MFGTVPRAIWAKLSPPDDENRILLAARSLIVRAGERVFMVDAGPGDRWEDKTRRLFDIRPAGGDGDARGPEGVTDIIVTHLHFDHARGLFRAGREGENEVELRYPGARVYVQAANFENARGPNARERASYIAEDTKLLERTPLVLTRGSQELSPGIRVHETRGHTRGHQWVEVRSEGRVLAFPADMVPTSKHLPLAYLMGYDIAAESLLVEKRELLDRAVAEGWIVVFEHDPDLAAARVKIDERGRYAVGEAVPL